MFLNRASDSKLQRNVSNLLLNVKWFNYFFFQTYYAKLLFCKNLDYYFQYSLSANISGPSYTGGFLLEHCFAFLCCDISYIMRCPADTEDLVDRHQSSFFCLGNSLKKKVYFQSWFSFSFWLFFFLKTKQYFTLSIFLLLPLARYLSEWIN